MCVYVYIREKHPKKMMPKVVSSKHCYFTKSSIFRSFPNGKAIDLHPASNFRTTGRSKQPTALAVAQCRVSLLVLWQGIVLASTRSTGTAGHWATCRERIC